MPKKEEERKLNINHWIRQLMSSLPLESTDEPKDKHNTGKARSPF